MMPMMLRGIRARLMALVVATVVPLALLIGVGLWIQWRDDQADTANLALVDARLIAAQVDDQLGAFESLLTGLSRAVSTDAAETRANDAMLRQVKSEFPAYVNSIMLFSLDGKNIGTSAEGVRIYAGDRDYFQLVLAGILLDRFQDAFRVRELPPGSVIQVVNENGIVITRSVDTSRWVGRNLQDNEHGARFSALKQASGAVLWPDNVERITASATTMRAPWLVSVGLPVDTGFANVVARLAWGSAAGIATLAFALVLAWMFSRRIITPLRQLSADASALAAGDLSHRSAVSTQDEVGALARTFNAMAAALEERHRELNEAHAAAATEAVKRALLEEMQRLAKETLAAVIDASPVAIVCSDVDRHILLWSRAAEQMFGYTSDEMLGGFTKIVPPDGTAESQALFERALAGDTVRDVQLKRMRKDGSLVDVRIAAARMYHVDGTVRGVAWAYEDITHRKKAEQQLERLAHFDQLTGLPNRVTLNEELGTLLAASQPTSIALFDLDRFKDVNDTLGHSVGDNLLIEVGRRLTALAATRAQVCRLGGDEFVVIVPGCGDPREIAEIIDAMLSRL